MIDELSRRKQACLRLYDQAIDSLRTLSALPQMEAAPAAPPAPSPALVDSGMMLSDESKRAVIERQKARWAEWKRADEA